MVVRVAQRAAQSGAAQVVVATDHEDICAACRQHGVNVQLTRIDHASGTDRVAEVAGRMGLADDAVVVNVQGDEPLIDPVLIAATAALVESGTPMATAACAIHDAAELFNPNVVKVVLNQAGRALYFSRAAIPWHRDGFAQSKQGFPAGYQPYRHIGLYAYRNGFLLNYPKLSAAPLEQIEALEQLRVLWHGFAIAVHITSAAPVPGVDTEEDLSRVRRHFSA
jgi:3-deoxy-manno-octulosonate cytidylyltransferase (CMP-KDO synthetase)